MNFHKYFAVEVTLSSAKWLLFKFSTTFRLMWVTEAKIITKHTHTHTHTNTHTHTHTQLQTYKQKNFVIVLYIAL